MTASIVTNDEEMKIYTDNRSITIINRWNNSEPWDIFLGDCAMTFPSHVVDDFIPEKICRKKLFIGIYFHILTQYKPIIGRISAFHGI